MKRIHRGLSFEPFVAARMADNNLRPITLVGADNQKLNIRTHSKLTLSRKKVNVVEAYLHHLITIESPNSSQRIIYEHVEDIRFRFGICQTACSWST